MEMIEIKIDLIKILKSSKRWTVLTGAGLSAESGIPTFRDAQKGLWAQFNPEELASREGFLQNPRRVWEWYDERRGLIAKARPNAGHLALVDLEKKLPRFTLITQNVDGLHRRAGSAHLLELHGDIQKSKCFEKNHPADSWEKTGEVPPRCARCGSFLRPDVIWFGEALLEKVLEESFRAAQDCDLFLSVGTSALVQPAALLPFEALNRGVPVVEINIEETPLTPYASYSLRGKAAETLPALVRALS
jgi:NAD-dependent protein deacetylase/lipoamidase